MADIKLSNQGFGWQAKLNGISSAEGQIIICTYSFSDIKYIFHILSKNPDRITLIAHSKFFSSALKIKKKYPYIKLYLSPHSHAKMVLIQPETVWISTENFGRTEQSFDATVGISSTKAYNHFYKQVQTLLEKPTTTKITEY